MYLVIAGKTRPFLEATLDDCGYTLNYNMFRQVVSVTETWAVSGRIILDQSISTSSAAATWMTQQIRQLRADLLTAVRPSIAFLNEDLTPTPYEINPGDCIDGPTISEIHFPRDGQDIFTSGNNYSFQIAATRAAVAAGLPLLEFSESIENVAGGLITGYIGGLINPAEAQILKAYEPYRYVQSGSAVGLYGYPAIPGPVYPSNMTRPCRPKLYSPEIVYPVPQRFKVEWSYEFEAELPLPTAIPHSF